MVKIIKEGKKEFIGNCKDCGCEFSYDIRDVALGSVPCPCCGHYYVHKLLDMKKIEALRLIRDLCIGYDGFNTVEGLKSLIDDVRGFAEEAIK